MPERIMVGIISTIPEVSMAATWVVVIHDIRSPRANETRINTNEIPNSSIRLPLTGTFNKVTDNSKIVRRFTTDRIK